MILVREALYDVFFKEGENLIKLKINKQASKGPGNEFVNIEGLPGSNGAKWLSLSKIEYGENVIKGLKAAVRTKATGGAKYELTPEEKAEVDELQGRIDAIIASAKSRYVAKPNFAKVDVDKMTDAEKLAELEKVKKFLGL